MKHQGIKFLKQWWKNHQRQTQSPPASHCFFSTRPPAHISKLSPEALPRGAAVPCKGLSPLSHMGMGHKQPPPPSTLFYTLQRHLPGVKVWPRGTHSVSQQQRSLIQTVRIRHLSAKKCFLTSSPPSAFRVSILGLTRQILVFMWNSLQWNHEAHSSLRKGGKMDSKAMLPLHHPKPPGRLQAQPSSTFSEVVAASSSSEVLQEKPSSALPFEIRSGAQDTQNYPISSLCWANFHQGFSLTLSSHPTPVTGTPRAPSSCLPQP